MMEIFDVFFNLMLKTLIYRLKGTENLLLILVVTVRTEKLKCLKRGMDFSQQQNTVRFYSLSGTMWQKRWKNSNFCFKGYKESTSKSGWILL